MKKKTKKHNRFIWLLISLVGVALAAPNSAVIKYTMGSSDPYVFNALRFLLIAVITTPLFLKHRQALSRKNIWYSLSAGLFMSIAVISYVWAIKLSQASYVSIITLLSPLIFIMLSVKFDHGKITRRALAGVSLAALGALTVVALPVALAQNQPFVFYPTATILALVNCIAFPLAILAFKQADDHRIPMLVSFSISSWVVFAANLIGIAIAAPAIPPISSTLLLGILYSGIAVALVSRIINIRSYEVLGAGTMSILSYMENLGAIMLPVLLLGEHLSPEMIAGGMLILIGVYMVEHRSGVHHKHHLRTHGR